MDEQRVNLTRFSLFFPEKRPFFLEGRDIFAFGGAGPSFGSQGAGDTPIMFFSRQIGLSGGRAIPIVAGARVTGQAGGYSVGLLNIQTDDDERAGAESTNFSVVRLKRNIFGRSTIGLLATHRSEAVGSAGSNTALGADARFALVSTLFIDTYYARTTTRGRSGNDTSYRGRIENNGDRYGFQAEHLRVGRDFNPEVGFLRRTDFRRSFGQLRFSPRTSRAISSGNTRSRPASTTTFATRRARSSRATCAGSSRFSSKTASAGERSTAASSSA